MHGAITDLLEPRSNLAYYETALEASCGALIALQLISASATGSSATARAAEVQRSRAIKSLRTTINSLRCAIEEIRASQSGGTNTPIVGFVLRIDAEHKPPSVPSALSPGPGGPRRSPPECGSGDRA